MDSDRKNPNAARLGGFLHGVLPGRVSGKLVPPALLGDWLLVAGEGVARRARPVCLEEDGVLVVAVSGAAWRQEITLAGPQLAARLRERGHRVQGVKAVHARLPEPPPPEPPPRQVAPEEEEAVERIASRARDPELRRALAKAMRAQLTRPEDPGK